MKPAILGGKPVRTKDFPSRKTMGAAEKRAVLRVMDSDILSGFLGAGGAFFNGGVEVKRFEGAWNKKFGFKHAISVNSWTTGLMACVGAVGVEPGDEVICPPYTMSASATAAMFYGGIPVFADIDPDNYCIDPKSVKKLITKRTKAIMVVHLYGRPADMDAILAIARPKGIKVIEDAAQAPGVKYKGRYVGAIGDIGGFSFNYHKHIHTGEGGLIVTNDSNLALKCQMIRNHGENAIDTYGVEDLSNCIGSNYRLTELQAAIASEQLTKLDSLLSHRQSLAAYLSDRLKGYDGLCTPKVEKNSTHSYYMFPIKYSEEKMGLPRSLFLRAVSAELPKPKEWETTPLAEGYVKPLYLSPVYQRQIALGSKGFPFNTNPGVKYDYSEGICPVTERLYKREMLLTPLVREPLTKRDIKDLADAIEKVAEGADEIRAAFRDSGAEDRLFDPVKAMDAAKKN